MSVLSADLTTPPALASLGDPDSPGPHGRVIHGESAKALGVLNGAGLAGTVKLAYLDPPYSTGLEFSTYTDRYTTAAWSTMMAGVLAGVREALAPDGSVWVHVDDRQSHTARALCEEVFGAGNFVGEVVWQRKAKPSFLDKHLADVTDRIIVFARDRVQLAPLTTGEQVAKRRVPLHNAINPPSTLTFPPGSVVLPKGASVIPAGDQSSGPITTQLLDDVRAGADGTNAETFAMAGPFRWSQAKLDEYLAGGDKVRCARLPLRPNVHSGSGNRVPVNLWGVESGMATNEDAREHARQLFGQQDFDTPKPEQLLERILTAATAPGDVVLDAFAGSGTTGAAAHKMGRDYVLIEQSAEAIERFILPRLGKVIDGTDTGGITMGQKVEPVAALPEGLSIKDAGRAAQWVQALAAAGALDPTVADQVAAEMRAQVRQVPTKSRWHGGGSVAVAVG